MSDNLPEGAVRVKLTEKRDGGKKEEGVAIILVREAIFVKTVSRKFSIAFKDIQDLQVNVSAASSGSNSAPKRFMMRFRQRNASSSIPSITYTIEFKSNDELQRTKQQLSQKITQGPHDGTTDAERKQRALLLQKYPNTLKRQYTDMVTGGLISDADFWNLPVRRQLLLAESAKRQKVGKTSEILSDVQGENQSGGKSVKYNLNPDIIHQIFVQYPVVYLAYQEQVPDKMSGIEFWGLFVKSKYAHRDHANKAQQQHQEDIFTKYEAKLQAQKFQNGPPDVRHVDQLINLSASYDVKSKDPKDAVETTSLVKFNRHGADVLQVKTNHAVAPVDSVAAAVEIEDLQVAPPEEMLPLNLDNPSRYFEQEDSQEKKAAESTPATTWRLAQSALASLVKQPLNLSAAFPERGDAILQDVIQESNDNNDLAQKQTDTRFISSDFKTQLTNHFHDVSELLRHYLSFKAKALLDPDARVKLERIKAKMGDKFEHLERIRNKLPPAEKTTLAPLLTPFLDQLNIPFLEDDGGSLKAF
ncbi:General transcription factor IIH subunit 1 [Aphanomyces cochlioides]|nr:General transcription factor IIH subunit 1 [Aphanomyces cochlioides]